MQVWRPRSLLESCTLLISFDKDVGGVTVNVVKDLLVESAECWKLLNFCY